jgi:GT2 family glycosyltransferase
MKYSIVIPYINRAALFDKSLDNYGALYGDRKDLEIIIIRDSKCDSQDTLHDVVANYKDYLNIRVIEQEATNLFSPVIHFNRGVKECSGEFIVITNPETLHETNILNGLDNEFAKDPEQCIVCACKTLDKNGEMAGWYQHSIYRPGMYYFCLAMSKKLYLDIGGFDEDFAEGHAFEDDDFRETIKKAGIRINQRDDLIACHQWHEPRNVKDRTIKWERNKALYESKHGKYYEKAISWQT